MKISLHLVSLLMTATIINSGCGGDPSDAFSCSANDTIKKVIDMKKEQIESGLSAMRSMSGLSEFGPVESAICQKQVSVHEKNLFMECVAKTKQALEEQPEYTAKIINIRTDQKNDAIKKSVCSADLIIDGNITPIVGTEIALNYQVQLTHDGNIYVQLIE